MRLQLSRLIFLTSVTIIAASFPACSPAQNLLANPAFTDGNVGFTSTYTYFTGSPLPEGRYVIAHSPREHHPLQADFGDHTTGTGLMMVVNGGTLTDVYDWPVWEETIPVLRNTLYDFSGWTTTADSLDTSPAVLAVRINGQTVIGSYTVPNHAADWHEFAQSWNSAGSTSALIQIFELNTASDGNDFVLDDLSFSAPVPEPSTALALAGGLALWARKRKPNRFRGRHQTG